MKKVLVFAVAIAFSFATFAQTAPKKDAPKKDVPKKEVKKEELKKKEEKTETKKVTKVVTKETKTTIAPAPAAKK